MQHKILNSIIILIVFLFSCSKDKDETKPSISIIAPTHLQQINGIDTVKVTATISDDRNIERVSVSLKDGNGIPIASTVTKTPNTDNYTLNISYFIDNIHLVSGQYPLTVSASDGENTSTSSVTINLNETPKSRTGLFVISNTGSTSDIYYLDNTYNGSFYKSISGDYLGSAVNSYDQQLIHASGGTVAGTNIKSIDLTSSLNAWNIPIINSPPIPFYTSFLYENESIYLGKRNGGIQGFNNNGASNYNAVVIPNFHVKHILQHDNKIITEQGMLSGSSVNLIPYWLASGNPTGINAALPPNESVVKMFTRSQNEIVVISNDASLNGNLSFYNPNTGAISSFPIGLGKIDDCVEVDIGIYLVVHTGIVSKINVNTGFPFSTPTVLISGTGANNIWYDDFLNEIFISNGSTLTIHNALGAQIGSYSHTNIIQEVIFWYNK